MKHLFILILFLIISNILTAQTVGKIPAQQVDSATQVVFPIGEMQDTVYLLAVLAQEKEPLKTERFIGITRIYVFENPKFNKTIEQWFERTSSAMSPNPSNKKITDFQANVIWYRVLPKQK